MGIQGRTRRWWRWWRRHEPEYGRRLSIAQVAFLALGAVLTLVLVAYTLKRG